MTNNASKHTGVCQSTNKNAYSERVAARKARYIAKAEELNRQSNSLARESSKMSEAIPFGQPILIGHHSETRDRNYRARISKKMDAAVAAQKKADYYAEKAESVGKGGISNADPEAQVKIAEKIARLEAAHEHGKEANKLWRKLYGNAVKNTGADGKEAFFVAIDDFKSTHPNFALNIARNASCYSSPNYSKLKPFSPDTAEINRLKKRLKFLQNQSSKESITIEKSAYKCVQDTTEMRVFFDFDTKPSVEARDILKRYGFKWSRYAKVWTRKLTGNAIYSAKLAISQLNALNIS